MDPLTLSYRRQLPRSAGTNLLLDARERGHHVAYLMESFFWTPPTDTEPMEPQINKLVEANRNLDTIGYGLNDKILAYFIIVALTEMIRLSK